MVESKEYFDAFNYWFDLLEKGVKTSKAVELTAKEFNKSPRMIWYIHRSYNWKGRAEEKQKKIREESDRETNKMYAESKRKYDLLLKLSDEIYELKYLFKNNFKEECTRDSIEYGEFKLKVLARDRVCQCCGSASDLEVHHLFSFKTYNHLGVDVNNAIVLCGKCHRLYHKEYGVNGVSNNPITLLSFLREHNPFIILDNYNGS